MYRSEPVNLALCVLGCAVCHAGSGLLLSDSRAWWCRVQCLVITAGAASSANLSHSYACCAFVLRAAATATL